jgi:hypothetical protein
MHNGTLIEDLMITVQRVESQARVRPVTPPVHRPPQIESYPAFSTVAYVWPLENTIIGVA